MKPRPSSRQKRKILVDTDASYAFADASDARHQDEESLAGAESEFINGRYNNAANRCYYACFQAAIAFSGIDLLAKFLAGNSDRGKVGERFGAFVMSYMGLSKDQADRVYEVRSAMMHSFGLYDPDSKVMLGVASGVPDTQRQVVQTKPDQWVIFIEPLYRTFVDSVRTYEADVRRGKDDLQAKFSRIFEHYGRLAVGTIIS